MKIKLVTFACLISLLNGQYLNVGDTVPDFSLPWCGNNSIENDSLNLYTFNGSESETGRDYIIWIMMFTSWCPYCEQEVPYTQEFYEAFQDSGLIVIGSGWDWGEPYNCEEWAENYNLTYPLIDNSPYGDVLDLFSSGGVPHNVVINQDMEIIYTAAGYSVENMDNIFNIISSALEECYFCTCTEIFGDLDFTFTSNNDPIIDVLDLLKLADIVYSGTNQNHCMITQGDITADGILDIVDIFAFATMLSEGGFNN